MFFRLKIVVFIVNQFLSDMLTVGGFRGKAWWEEEEADMIQFFRFRKSKLRIKNFKFDALVKKKIAKRKAETKSTNGGDLKKLSDEQMQE